MNGSTELFCEMNSFSDIACKCGKNTFIYVMKYVS